MAGFELFPAIDLRDGRCVRLHQGDFAAETVYDDDPARVAREFEQAGARWLHVVDLDAARSGAAGNLESIRAIIATVACRVEVGGGVRSAEAAALLLDAGVARVVIGSAAVERPALVDELLEAYPGRVAVGLDARGDDVAIHGWLDGTGAALLDMARRFDVAGLGALIVTEIARDGTMDGPAVDQLAAVLQATSVPVVASGGVGTVDDIRSLGALRADGRALAGVIVGRAIYEERFTVGEALTAAAAASVAD